MEEKYRGEAEVCMDSPLGCIPNEKTNKTSVSPIGMKLYFITIEQLIA